MQALKAALQHSKAGSEISVIFREGVYELNAPITLQASDFKSETKLNMMAYQNEEVVISGAKRLKGFKLKENGHWQLTLPKYDGKAWAFDQLFISGHRSTRAKEPDTGFFYMHDVQEKILPKAKGRSYSALQRVRCSTADLEPLQKLPDADIKQVVMTVYHKWDVTKRRLHELNEDNFIVAGRGMKAWNGWHSGQRYILENYAGALDEPGEWFLDANGKLTYIPLPGQTIETTEVMAPFNENFIRLKGSKEKKLKDLHFKGLKFRYSNHRLAVGGFEANQAASVIGAAVELEHAKDVTFQNCELGHLGKYALWIRKGCENVKVQHCYLHDLGAGGVKIGESRIESNPLDQCRDHTIDNNIIVDGGHNYACAVGVWVGQSGYNKITHNEIASFYYTGVSLGWSWHYGMNPAVHNHVLYNHIHHLGYGLLSDMGGVYTLGHSPGTKVNHNRIHDVYAYTYGGWGLYTDQGSSYIEMRNNLVYHTKSGGFHQHYGKENTIANNIFANNFLQQLQFTRVEEHTSLYFNNNIVFYKNPPLFASRWALGKLESHDNLYWHESDQPEISSEQLKKLQREGKELGSQVLNPGFVNPDQMNFSFRDPKHLREQGFEVFNPDKAGVYGDQAWVQKAAQLDLIDFRQLKSSSPPPFPIIYDFEFSNVGSSPKGLSKDVEKLPQSIAISHHPKRPGGQVLKITDSDKLERTSNPHFSYQKKYEKGIGQIEFELCISKDSQIVIEGREYEHSNYKTGPMIRIHNQQLQLPAQTPLTLKVDEFYKFKISLRDKSWNLILELNDQVVAQKDKLTYSHKDYAACVWIGFMSNLRKESVYYIDNIKIYAAD